MELLEVRTPSSENSLNSCVPTGKTQWSMSEVSIFVPGGKNKLLTFSRRFLTKKAQAKLNEKFYEDVTEPQTRNRKRGDVEAKLEHS